ncbi:hypothetical protein FOA52_008834 [Chlamydomonas sp. UWO 241]|nr:hypothetical protein FOA52_008834 [Chlamydomonas sp. UWO 241]
MARSSLLAAALLCALIAAPSAVLGCMWVYGTAPDGLAPPSNSHYDFAFDGQNWQGECASGMQQSPIDFPKAGNSGYAASAPRTGFKYDDLVSDGETLVVMNTGHNIQVQFDGTMFGEILVPNRGLPESTVHDVLNYPASEMTSMAKGYPVQFHFHTKSEHTMEGVYFPLEMHIVNVVPGSELPGCGAMCIVPVGVMFRETLEDNPVIETILSYASMREGEVTVVPKGVSINLSELIPASGNGKVLQYAGSLTTPPCQEGFLWHVFAQASYMSRKQLDQIMTIMSFKECTLANETNSTTHNDMADPEIEAMGSRKLQQADGTIKRFMLPADQIKNARTHYEHAHAHEHADDHAHAHSRSMAATDPEAFDPDAYECKPSAYGNNARRIQDMNARKIYRYAKA